MTANPGKYKEIDIRDIISSAKMELNIDNMDNDLYFLKLANEGVRQLDCLSIFQRQEKILPICDGKVQLPCGFNQFMVLYFCDSTAINSGQQLYLNSPFLNNYNIDTTSIINGSNNSFFAHYSGTFQIVGDYIVFGNANLKAEYCNLIYFGLNTTEDGMMKVYDYYERALTAYICYKFTRQNFKDYPQYIQIDFKREWTNQKAFVKGTDVQDDAKNNMWQIKRIFNAWMLNQNSQQYDFNSAGR